MRSVSNDLWLGHYMKSRSRRGPSEDASELPRRLGRAVTRFAGNIAELEIALCDHGWFLEDGDLVLRMAYLVVAYQNLRLPLRCEMPGSKECRWSYPVGLNCLHGGVTSDRLVGNIAVRMQEVAAELCLGHESVAGGIRWVAKRLVAVAHEGEGRTMRVGDVRSAVARLRDLALPWLVALGELNTRLDDVARLASEQRCRELARAIRLLSASTIPLSRALTDICGETDRALVGTMPARTRCNSNPVRPDVRVKRHGDSARRERNAEPVAHGN